MVSATLETDVFIAGGGPAGLAAALAARQAGLGVVLADRATPPIDKACGEGLMPDGLAALRRLGVEPRATDGHPFRGLRFVDGPLVAQAEFPEATGMGIRRTILHRLLAEHAADSGVTICWRTPFEIVGPGAIKLGDRRLRCRWLIGADGRLSQIRRVAGLPPIWTARARIGVRRHFRIRPWSEFVEVHWARAAQAYVTPVGPDEVCVALLGAPPGVRFAELPALFPELAKRLAGAEPSSKVLGAHSMTTRSAPVTRGRTALIGDAASGVDAITGEGLSLAFGQAAALGAALRAGDLPAYETAHRRLTRLPRLMARVLLGLGSHDALRHGALRLLAAEPKLFDALVAAHIGARGPATLALDLGRLALGLAIRAPFAAERF